MTYYKYKQGFTLIELMITVMILAILTAIAIPSYQRYVVRNAELGVQAQMQELEVQLESWRASALTYKGFVPYRGDGVYGYDTYGFGTKPNSIIFYPAGSNQANASYLIELLDGTSDTSSGADVRRSLYQSTASSSVNLVLGKSWVMVAYPRNKIKERGAKRFFMNSQGYKCMAEEKGRRSEIGISSNDCSGAGVEAWQ